MTLDDVFGTQGHVDWAQECARTVLIFAWGLALVRVGGRRAFGRWTAIDIVVAIVVGSNLSRALTGSAPLWGTLLATTLLFALHGALANAAARWHGISRVVEGMPAVLGRDGALDAAALVRHAVSDAAVQEALRAAGLEAARGSRLVVLEPSGRITVLKSGAG
jgi:uncharacterized membrane protein YcaP (DUF421 family)